MALGRVPHSTTTSAVSQSYHITMLGCVFFEHHQKVSSWCSSITVHFVMDADDRDVRELALRRWLKENTSDIRQDRAVVYSKTFYDNNASTIVRVGKKVREQGSSWLVDQLQIDPDDADDIVVALRAAKLVPPPTNENGNGISTQLKKKETSSNGIHGVDSARDEVFRSDTSSPMAR